MKRVLFVCMGNIHRSVIAEVHLRRLLAESGITDIEVFSRGIQGSAGTPPPKGLNLRDYPLQWKASSQALIDWQIDMTDHVAQPVTLDAVRSADLVIAMDELVLATHSDSLQNQFPELVGKMHLFDELSGGTEGVEDVGASTIVHEHVRVVDRICQTLDKHVQTLLEWLN